MKQSLGLLEVSGLALAISCADVMAKAASITLVGLENQRLRLDGDQDNRGCGLRPCGHFHWCQFR